MMTRSNFQDNDVRMKMGKQKCNRRMFSESETTKKRSECSKAQQGSQLSVDRNRSENNAVAQDASSARPSRCQFRVEGQQKLFQCLVGVCRKCDYPLHDYEGLGVNRDNGTMNCFKDQRMVQGNQRGQGSVREKGRRKLTKEKLRWGCSLVCCYGVKYKRSYWTKTEGLY